MKQTWLPIPGYEDYWVSDDGHISFKGGPSKGTLKTTTKEKGYLFVNLRYGVLKKVTMYVHRAVLLAFIGFPPYGRNHGHHIDGSTNNNHYKNLEWKQTINQYDHPDMDKYPESPEDE